MRALDLRAKSGKIVIASPPIDILMVAPDVDGTFHRWRFDGQAWSTLPTPRDLRYRLPSCYTFAIDTVQIDNTRSPHQDSDLAVATLAVGEWLPQHTSFDMHDVNNGTYSYDQRITFNHVVVELCEPVMFNSSITNKGDSIITDVVKVLTGTVQKGTEDYVNDLMKSAAAGAAGGATLAGSLGGAAFAVAMDWAVSEVIGWATQSCDGLITAESIVYQKGRDLQDRIATRGTNGKLTWNTRFLGGDAPGLCQQSDYTVSSSITQS